MTDILTLGSNAVTLYQRALGTVSNNISNANTEGYSRQRVEINQNPSTNRGGLWFGNGARLQSITRMFDGLVENNLRRSTSDYAAMQPQIAEATRIIDLFGSTTAGVSGALDRFFSSVREWSIDPDFVSLRNQVLSDATLLVERFHTMDTLLRDVESDTAIAIQQEVATINTYASQIAEVNRALGRQVTLEKQSPQLLDQRDNLLRKLSEHVRLDVREAANGVVTVNMGFSATSIPLVDGFTSQRIVARTDALQLDRIDLIIDPDVRAELLGGVAGGTLGGLMAFRQGILATMGGALDQVAEVFVREINALHAQGVDQRGEFGAELFRIDPKYQLFSEGANLSGFAATSEVIDTQRLTRNEILLRYDPATLSWSAIDQGTRETATVNPATNRIEISGLAIQVRGNANSLTELRYRPLQTAAGGIQVGVTRIEELASASPLRVRPDQSNTSPINPSLLIRSSEELSRSVPPLADRLIDNLHPGPGLELTVRPSVLDPVLFLPAGYTDVALSIQHAGSSDLQIFTREGRHLAGSALSPTVQAQLLKQDNGFAAGARYSNDYLTGSGAAPYVDLQIFRGIRAEPGEVPGTDGIYLEDGVFRGARAYPVAGEPASITTPQRLDFSLRLEQGALAFNGVPLASSIAPATDARQVAQIINRQSAESGVQARAFNEVRFSATEIDLDNSLVLNGIAIGERFTSTQDLLDRINLRSDQSGVRAFESPLKEVVLTNVGGEEGLDIRVSALEGLRFEPGEIDLEGSLSLNGVAVANPTSGFANLNALVNAINATTNANPASRVQAAVENGELVLRSAVNPGEPTNPIVFAGDLLPERNVPDIPPPSVFGAQAEPYSGFLEFVGLNVGGRAQPVLIELTSVGRTADLSRMGFGRQLETVEATMRSKGRLDLSAQIPDGALRLNGQTLSAIPAGSDAAFVAARLNELQPATGVKVTAFNEIRVPRNLLRLDVGIELKNLNGTSRLLGPNGFTDLRTLINAVNATSSETGVQAYQSPKGELVLTNTGDRAGKDIEFGNYGIGNVLGLTPGRYSGYLEFEGVERNGILSSIHLELTADGRPQDFQRLGLSTQVYVDGKIEEDLLVFVTGNNADRPALTASYTTGQMSPLEQVRARELNVEFVTADSYLIRDEKTGTVLSERSGWSFTQPLVYGSMELRFRVPPQPGDVFRVDRNATGVADNTIAEAMAALELERLADFQGNTIGEAYSRIIVELGGNLRQMTLSEQALKVVQEQAKEARDQVSGVNLDEEATDLIRYQQAFQASARIIQTSQQLFETILRL